METILDWGERLAAWLDRRVTAGRARAYGLIFLVCGGLFYVAAPLLFAPLRHGAPILGDYLARYTAGRFVLAETASRLYEVGAQEAFQQRAAAAGDYLSLFVSPPFSALIYLPLALLPYTPSALLWLACSLTLLLVAAALIRPLVPRLGARWSLVLVVAAGAQPTLELLGGGQDSALALLLWIGGVRLAVARRDGAAGLVFALGLFKPQLFFLAPLIFLGLRRWRSLASWAATASGLALASLAVVGPSGVLAWLDLLRSPLYRSAAQDGQAWKMQSLSALTRSLVPARFGGGAELAGVALGLVLAGGCALVVWRMRDLTAPREALVWGFAAITTFLAAPHVLIYDMVVLLPAILVLLERTNTRPVRLALVALAFLTWSSLLRNGFFGALPWPLDALGASWGALPLLALWFVQRRLLAAPTVERAAAELRQPRTQALTFPS